MSDGTETLDLNTPDLPASAGVETGSHATDTASNEVQDLDALTDLSEEGATETDELHEPEEEFEEVERNGKKYRIPKALSGELMMQSDYTKKTQTVAEERKALEAEKEAIVQQAKAVKELNDERKKLVLIDDYLEKQSRVDWNRLWQEDPLDTPRRWAEYQHWQGQRENLNSKISDAEHEAALNEERTVATRVQEALTEAKKIPGWKDGETGVKVEQHAQSYGLTVPQLNDLVKTYGLPIIKMAHEAMLGRQVIQQKQAAAKVPAVAQEPVKPLAPVATRGASPAVRKDLNSMSTEEYFAARKAGRKS